MMKAPAKKTWLCFASLLLLAFQPQLKAQQKQANKPNILLLLTDDAGYADFSFMTNRLVPTPNIDWIAKQGVKFTNAYVTGAVCSPSRAGLLTGINQAEFGHTFNYIQGVKYNIEQKDFGIALDKKLVGNYLKPLGYTSGIVGKWHEGFSEAYQPNQRGFDYFWGFLWGSSPYYTGKAKLVLEDGVHIEADSIPYMTDAIGNKAVDFINHHQSDPFFLYVSFNAPHTPMQAKPEYLEKTIDKFPVKGRAINAAMTMSIDENVGKIIETLRSNGQLDNTLIVFANDNGGQIEASFADNYPLRGKKGDVYEGGIRVPMSMMWKGHIPAGMEFNSPVSTLDFIPTFLGAAGSGKPKNTELEGINLLPFLEKKETAPAPVQNRIMYWYVGIDKGSLRNGDWKLVCLPSKEPELFNLKADIAETTELSAKYPDVKKKLYAAYLKWKNSLPTPTWIPDKEELRTEIH